MEELHKPVMLSEVLEVLAPKSGETYLDLTAGYAGHASEILGDVSYSTIAAKRIRLRNTSDLPLTLVDYKATCRCTWIDLPHGAIAPNEWAEAELIFDSRGEYGTVGNYIEVITSDDRCRIGIWMSADII